MTVPTLWATSNIYGSAAGYTLGQADIPSTLAPLPTKRKLESRHDLVEPHMSPDLPSLFSSRTSTPSLASPCFSDNSEPSCSVSSRRADEHTRSVKSRKLTAEQLAAGVPLGAGHPNDTPNESVVLGNDLHEYTPISKWKRFSSLTLSTFSSPASSLRPDSRSISFSNVSSTGFFGSEQPQRPTVPNKLVKRSLSQRNTPTSSPTSFRARIPTRKTATGYQPYSSPLEQTPEHDTANCKLDQGPPDHSAGGHEQWLHYFGAKFGKLGITQQKSKPSGGSSHTQRSSPGTIVQPAILLSGSLSLSAQKTNDDNGQRKPVFSPETPRSFSSPLRKLPASNDPEKEDRAKRSWSISNLLNITPPSRKFQSPKNRSSAKLTRKKGRSRVGLNELEAAAVVFDSQERPSKRRDLSYPESSVLRGSPVGHVSQRQATRPDATFCDPESSSSPKSVHLSSRKIPDESLESPELINFRNSAGSDLTPSLIGLSHPYTQFSRHSRSPSDPDSIGNGSDCGTRIFSSGDEEDGDQRSDTIYDSLRTGMTRSSYGGPGIKLETLFDAVPCEESMGPTTVIDMLSAESENRQTAGNEMRQDGPEKTNSSSGAEPKSKDQEYPTASTHFGSRKLSGSSSSSASTSLRPSNLDRLVDEATSEEEDENSSSRDGDEAMDDFNEIPANEMRRSAESPPSTGEESWDNFENMPSSAYNTPQRPIVSHADYEMKNSLFDWSEQPSAEKPSIDMTPPRPKTVHGKKDAESRGGRSSGRRAPSAPHARSQSVPVIPDVSSKRTNITSKFGTWGVGSKIVTEEWDEDFEFDNDSQGVRLAQADEGKRVDSAVAMFVPQKIRQQQTNVLANIGLLKEWGMLIEELKELRGRATTLGLVVRQHDNVFEQVDAMIDLADQEVDDEEHDTTHSISSSSGFNANDFDSSPVPSQSSRSQSRPDIIGEDDIFGSPKPGPSSSQTSPRINAALQSTPPTPVRSRKDSEAVAQSVIELLQKRNRNPLAMLPAEKTSSGEKKVPFDTATLKHIVPHVNGLMHKLKQILREAEGLQSNPTSPRREAESPFSHVFADPREDSPTALKHSRLTAHFADDDDVQDSDFEMKEQELVTHVKLMNIM